MKRRCGWKWCTSLDHVSIQPPRQDEASERHKQAQHILVCFRRSSARWVLRAAAGCLGPCSCAPVLVLLVLVVGRLSVLECAFWGCPLFHLFPLLRLFVTKHSTEGPRGLPSERDTERCVAQLQQSAHIEHQHMHAPATQRLDWHDMPLYSDSAETTSKRRICTHSHKEHANTLVSNPRCTTPHALPAEVCSRQPVIRRSARWTAAQHATAQLT